MEVYLGSPSPKLCLPTCSPAQSPQQGEVCDDTAGGPGMKHCVPARERGLSPRVCHDGPQNRVVNQVQEGLVP